MNIAITGCSGRMGREVIKSALALGHRIVGGSVSPASIALGKDLGILTGGEKIGVLAVDNLAAACAQAEVVIDFSRPEITLELAALAAAEGRVLVTGTTGLTPAQQAVLEGYARHTAIVQSFNMSLGVNLLAALVEKVAATLEADFDIEILEMHHRQKVDAPSGTALLLGEAAAHGRKVNLAEVARGSREGVTGLRPTGEIGFAVLRGGDVVGDHSVIFAGPGERISLSHQSSSRAIYAQGAIRAAHWAQGKSAGLYSMRDVLGLEVV